MVKLKNHWVAETLKCKTVKKNRQDSLSVCRACELGRKQGQRARNVYFQLYQEDTSESCLMLGLSSHHPGLLYLFADRSWGRSWTWNIVIARTIVRHPAAVAISNLKHINHDPRSATNWKDEAASWKPPQNSFLFYTFFCNRTKITATYKYKTKQRR